MLHIISPVMPLSVRLDLQAVVLSFKPPEVEIPRYLRARLQRMAHAMSATGVVARPFTPDSSRIFPNYTIWNVRSDGAVFIEEAIAQARSNSVDSSYCTFERCFGAWLLSPTYYDTHNNGWKDNLRLVLGCVEDRVFWRANSSAALHIHVGRERDENFTMPQVKRLAMLVCRFEGMFSCNDCHENLLNSSAKRP